jgi:pyruvate formate lyase activating enzyme
VDQVVEELLRDRAFYQESRGGITLSGGEPLLQPDFAGAILRRCKAQGIHTAIETAGNYPWAILAPLLPLVDLVMMDIKHMDPHKHRAGSGVTNGRILDNARKLAGTDLPLIFRVPVVPGFNDGAGEMAAIAAFVRQLVDSRSGDGRDGSDEAPFPAASISLELLRFHPLAADKYRALGLANPTDGLQRPSDETIAELVGVAQMAGLEVKA